MLTELIVPPTEVSENLGLSGLLLLKAIVSAVEVLEGLPKLSWLWMVIGPPVGLEVAAKLKAELVKTSLLAAAAVTVSAWVGVELKAPLPVAVMVGVTALVSPYEKLTVFTLLGMLTEGIVPPPAPSENFGRSGLLLLKAIVSAV